MDTIGEKTTHAQLCFRNGDTEYYDDQTLAYAIWLALPAGARCAFRGKGDMSPLYPWDYVDRH